MTKVKKRVGILACIAILVLATAGVTMAYFTDSEQAVNTFTVGKVGITLDEADVNADGTEIAGAARVTENAYHLIPGHSYVKDPTVHVDADSEDCWLFVKIENQITDIEGVPTVASQMADNWTLIDETNGIYAYNEDVKASDDITVFKTFTVDGDNVDNDKLAAYKGKQINVTAYAIQKAGFETAEKAWNTVGGKF